MLFSHCAQENTCSTDIYSKHYPQTNVSFPFRPLLGRAGAKYCFYHLSTAFNNVIKDML